MFLLQVNSSSPSGGCQCVAENTLKNKEPKAYHHAGWGQTEEDLIVKFEKLLGVACSSGELNFVKLFYTTNNLNACKPYSNVYKQSANEKTTVFFKNNNCPVHCYVIIAIIHRDILKTYELNKLKKQVWSIVSTLFFPPVRGKGNGRVNGCDCNGTELVPTGGTRTAGCTRSLGYQGRCKWYQRAAKSVGRLLFSMGEPAKSKSNDENIKAVCTRLADICSQWTAKLAPIATYNMLRTGVNAQECRLGHEQPKLFSGCSFVSDYTAHKHFDSSDYPDGITCLFSLQHQDRPGAQMHCLVNYALENGGSPGVAFDLGDNSILIETASREKHASTRIIQPNLREPSRVGLVFFQHMFLDRPDHGSLEEERRLKHNLS